jgi:hypothetical protein
MRRVTLLQLAIEKTLFLADEPARAPYTKLECFQQRAVEDVWSKNSEKELAFRGARGRTYPPIGIPDLYTIAHSLCCHGMLDC